MIEDNDTGRLTASLSPTVPRPTADGRVKSAFTRGRHWSLPIGGDLIKVCLRKTLHAQKFDTGRSSEGRNNHAAAGRLATRRSRQPQERELVTERPEPNCQGSAACRRLGDGTRRLHYHREFSFGEDAARNLSARLDLNPIIWSAVLGSTDLLEIGRASCRERVCLYV